MSLLQRDRIKSFLTDISLPFRIIIFGVIGLLQLIVAVVALPFLGMMMLSGAILRGLDKLMRRILW